jgi:predicted HAD superfamily Cof-like phosphohydrolase
MNIVLEGHDNSGKSTLAQAIARRVGRKVISSEGPEKYPGELKERVAYYSLQQDAVFDRHPCISDPIYAIARGKPSSMDSVLIHNFYNDPAVFIYCDPGTRGLGGHVGKEHDTPEHLAAVESNYQSILAKYRQWGVDHAHFIYRIGDDPQPLIEAVAIRVGAYPVPFDPVRDVQQFMKKFGQDYDGAPRALPSSLGTFREDFMEEELSEYKKHSRRLASLLDETPFTDVDGVTHELDNILDALVDKIYIDIGTALLHGFDLREAFRRVHFANMQKERVARASESTRYSAWDVRKPAGWTAPSHKDLVQNHIHK